VLFHCVNDFFVKTQYGVKAENYFPTQILEANKKLETKGQCLFLTKVHNHLIIFKIRHLSPNEQLNIILPPLRYDLD
jgi:hypothetical protein